MADERGTACDRIRKPGGSAEADVGRGRAAGVGRAVRRGVCAHLLCERIPSRLLAVAYGESNDTANDRWLDLVRSRKGRGIAIQHLGEMEPWNRRSIAGTLWRLVRRA